MGSKSEHTQTRQGTNKIKQAAMHRDSGEADAGTGE